MCLDAAMDKLDASLIEILDKHAPLIQRRIQAKRREPWITPIVVKAIRSFRVSERKYRKDKTVCNMKDFQAKRKQYE